MAAIVIFYIFFQILDIYTNAGKDLAPADQGCTPRITDSKADQHHHITRSNFPFGARILESNRDRGGNCIAVVLKGGVELFGRDFHFLSKMFEHELIRLMKNKAINVIQHLARPLKQLLNCSGN